MTRSRTAAHDIGELRRAGAPIVAGSDSGAPLVEPGEALHDELRLLVEAAGFTPAAALRSATSEAARALDLPHLGRIGEGLAADVVVLHRNPLLDIRHTREIDAVVFRGEALTTAHLNRLRSGKSSPNSP